jgi:hypothetical protein
MSYSVPFAVADGHHSSDDISSTSRRMTLSGGHPLPRTVLNSHLIRDPSVSSEQVLDLLF